MPTKSIHEFDTLLEINNINVNKLGCVMLPCEPFDIFGEGRDQWLKHDDLYVSENPEQFWIQGDVSNKAHVTLLYGLMTPAFLQKENIEEVLNTWDRPEFLAPERISIFPQPGTEHPEYAAIVVEIDDPHILEAHQRLSYLPHINTFPEFKQHMTLAYVRFEEAQKWMDVLERANFHIYPIKDALDLGSPKSEETE